MSKMLKVFSRSHRRNHQSIMPPLTPLPPARLLELWLAAAGSPLGPARLQRVAEATNEGKPPEMPVEEAMAALQIPVRGEDVLALFAYFDPDESGAISFQELNIFFRSSRNSMAGSTAEAARAAALEPGAPGAGLAGALGRGAPGSTARRKALHPARGPRPARPPGGSHGSDRSCAPPSAAQAARGLAVASAARLRLRQHLLCRERRRLRSLRLGLERVLLRLACCCGGAIHVLSLIHI